MVASTIAVALSASLGVGGASAGVPPTQATGPTKECVTQAPTAAEAAEVAAACRTDVVVGSETDPWTLTTVRADGLTEVTSSIVADRAADGRGGWTAVDASFAGPAGGRIGLVAPAVEMSFSDGTAGEPLAKLVKDGHELSYDTSFDLPAPVVDEAARSLEYSNVAPGVDLVVTVAEDGSSFTQVLRVASRQALEHPKLKDLLFPVEASEGLTVRESDTGDLEVVDAEGALVFTAPVPVAWDSAGDAELERAAEAAASVSTRAAAGLRAGKAPGRVIADLQGGGQPRRESRPVDGDRVSKLEVDLAGDGDDIALALDPALVESATFPLFIDPSVSGSQQGRAYVQSAFPTTAHWNDTTQMPVGACTSAIGCSPTNVNRSYFQWVGLEAVGAVDPADIVSSTVTVYGVHSYSCTATEVRLFHTGGISSGTTWNAQPSLLTHMSSQTVAHKSACNNMRDIAFDARQGALVTAEGNHSQLTVGLIAGNEGDVAGWKRYENARISITYNRAPLPPTNLSTSPATSCVTSGELPYINDSTPTFSWRVTDPDGGNVIANLDIVKIGAAGFVYDMPEDWAQGSGSTFAKEMPFQLENGATYEWRAGGKDVAERLGTPYGSMSACRFVVDTQAPNLPSVSSTTYPEEGFGGALGQSAAFTFAANGSTDVKTYRWSLNGGPVNEVAPGTLGGSVTQNIAPSVSGTNRVVVSSVDRAGNVSPDYTYWFNVPFPDAAAVWYQDEGSGTVANDSSTGGAHDLTLTGIDWVAGARLERFPDNEPDTNRALRFDANTDKVESSSLVLDTSGSYTVSAFVKLEQAPTSVHVAVTQDGQQFGAFKLGHLPGGYCTGGMSGCWGFWMSTLDGPGAQPVFATSAVPVRVGEWVHLTGIRDKAANTIRIYACPLGLPGEPEPSLTPVLGQTTTFDPAVNWAAGGKVQLGRALVGGSYSEFWKGSVDDVRLFPGIVSTTTSDNQVARLCQGGFVPAPTNPAQGS